MVCVLPGWDDVLARDFRFISALISDDFPTLDFPAKATSSNRLSGIALVIPQTVSKFTFLIIIFILLQKEFGLPSELLIDGRLIRTAANSAILYTPGSRIYYRAAGEEYRNDWIRFRSDHSFVKLFPLTNTPFPVTDPEYCHQLFKLLTWESAFFSSESEANITHLLRVLFSKLREGIQNESPGIHDHELIALHKMIYNNPQLPWNINMMAAKLHLSPSHLQALYHRQFGSSCMDNVIEGRLRRAQDLLEYSEYSIRDISEQCGYNNVEHFCRQFRQHNGCTPGQYRKNASAGSNKRLLTHNTLGGREFEKINRNHPVAESFP